MHQPSDKHGLRVIVEPFYTATRPFHLFAPYLHASLLLLLFLLPHPHDKLVSLLPQRHPDPEPADHLQEEEGKADAVLQHIAAPGAGGVIRVVGRRVGEVRLRRGEGVEGRARTGEEGVENEEEGEEGAQRSCLVLASCQSSKRCGAWGKAGATNLASPSSTTSRPPQACSTRPDR